MIPDKNSEYYKIAKFQLLEFGDIIEKTDEYYNPINDDWKPVDKEFIGCEWDSDTSKPVRRKVKAT